MAPDYALGGKTVMVTGAARGIGRAIACAFAAQVATLTSDLDRDDDMAQLHAATRDFSPQLDVLVNNAGAEYPTPIDDTGPAAQAQWSKLLDNNAGGMARTIRTLLPLPGTGASIINQASIWGVAGFSACVASKHAVIGRTRSLAWELAPRGIRVNAVCPGWIRTEAAKQGRSDDALLKDILSAQAMPELLEPADITGIYLFLASHDARAITGQSIAVSNGEVMH